MARDERIILDEYNRRSALGKLGVAADDLARIFASGVTGGLADYNDAEVARTNEARTRSGMAGDLTTAGSWLTGGGAALKAAKPIYNAVRAAPRVSGKALAGVAGMAGLTGLAAMMRTGDGGEMPAAETPAAPRQRAQYSPAFPQAQVVPNQSDALLANIRTLFPGKNKMSLRQLGAVSQALGQQPVPKPVGMEDVIRSEAMQMVNASFAEQMAAAKAAPDPESRIELERSAVRDRQAALLAMLKVDPLALMQAEVE